MATETAEFKPLHIAEDFPTVPTEAWEAAIVADLKGADYEKRLVWRSEEGIAVRPYYRKENVPGEQAAPGNFPFTRGDARSWQIDESGSIPADAVNAARWHESGATAVEEIAFAIAEGVELLAGAANADETAAKTSFVFAVGSNYFFEIAKLRAARLLWARAAGAFDGVEQSSACMKIHARTALANKSIYDPYTNLLRVTTEALSAVIGGCDSLYVAPARFPDRLAVNVQHILREESHMDTVADPAGGSYYVEALTDAMAAAAWKLFQEVEAQGGFAKAQDFIEQKVAASRAAKEKAMSTRRKVMVGVNNYPNTRETALDEMTELPGSFWRQARAFEEIRLRTERHAKATGKTPRLLLLKRGDLKMKMARATFVLNFFGCAGFDIVESEEIDPTADLIVLCSSDPEYLDFATDVVPKVKVPVLVAGNPKDQIDALTAAGVAGFVHVLSNHVATLNEWQDKVGVTK